MAPLPSLPCFYYWVREGWDVQNVGKSICCGRRDMESGEMREEDCHLVTVCLKASALFGGPHKDHKNVWLWVAFRASFTLVSVEKPACPLWMMLLLGFYGASNHWQGNCLFISLLFLIHVWRKKDPFPPMSLDEPGSFYVDWQRPLENLVSTGSWEWACLDEYTHFLFQELLRSKSQCL